MLRPSLCSKNNGLPDPLGVYLCEDDTERLKRGLF